VIVDKYITLYPMDWVAYAFYCFTDSAMGISDVDKNIIYIDKALKLG
jgi:hypothetical protein